MPTRPVVVHLVGLIWLFTSVWLQSMEVCAGPELATWPRSLDCLLLPVSAVVIFWMIRKNYRKPVHLVLSLIIASLIGLDLWMRYKVACQYRERYSSSMTVPPLLSLKSRMSSATRSVRTELGVRQVNPTPWRAEKGMQHFSTTV